MYPKLSPEQLKEYTNNFSKENYIGDFQFGKVYHGKVETSTGELHVVVKMWKVPEIYKYYPGDNELRLADEIILLQHQKLIRHPAMVNLYGYCSETENLGIVYNFKPLDTVYNLLGKGVWTQQSDVFAFGVVLLGLITKRVFNVEDRLNFDVPLVYESFREEYKSDKSDMGIKKSKRSLVHKDVEADPDFHPTDGQKIRRLVYRYVQDHPFDRPTMKDVVKCLLKLRVVKDHAGYLDVYV